MKKMFLLIFMIFCLPIVHASDISDTFTEKFESMIPPENSSVHSDYLFEQIALGSEYTVMMLNQLNGSNDKLNEKVDVMIEKFDILIEQNKRIINLLENKNKDS